MELLGYETEFSCVTSRRAKSWMLTISMLQRCEIVEILNAVC